VRGRCEGDFGCERDLPAPGDEDGSAVLRGVPDDRHDDGGDEELRETDLVREHLERADEDLGDERRHRGGDREDR